MSTADRLLHDLRALLAEFRSPEHRDWLTSACADRLEAVLTEHAPPKVGSCANQLAGWLRTQSSPTHEYTGDPKHCHPCAVRAFANAELRTRAVERELHSWRSWAQWVYLGGGPVTLGDDALRMGVNETHDREMALEVCICAAIRLADGEVFRGHRHDDAIHTASKCDVPRERIYNAEQGFITSKNRFVGRIEGARLQRAAGIPSAFTKVPPSSMLFSEDLYLRSTNGMPLPAASRGGGDTRPPGREAAMNETDRIVDNLTLVARVSRGEGVVVAKHAIARYCEEAAAALAAQAATIAQLEAK